MDAKKNMDGANTGPSHVTGPLWLTPQPQSGEGMQPSVPAPPRVSSGVSGLTGGQQAPAPGLAGASAPSGDDHPPVEQTREEGKKPHKKTQDRQLNWLMSDPQQWVGRKVRSRRNFAVYTITQVYKTGRVKLERNWMTYLMDAQTVRTQYDSHC
jgi:hypothetical protein